MFPFYNLILYNLWFPVAFRNIKWELQPEILLVETAKVYMIDQTYFKNQGKCLTYSKTASYFGNTSGSDSIVTISLNRLSRLLTPFMVHLSFYKFTFPFGDFENT